MSLAIENPFNTIAIPIPARTPLFHASLDPSGLTASGRFDARFSNNDGAFYFTPEPVVQTNITCRLNEGAVIFSYNNLPDKYFDKFQEIGDENWWLGAEIVGFDGRSYHNPDPYAKLPRGGYCEEIVIFKSSLHKIADIRSYRADSHQ